MVPHSSGSRPNWPSARRTLGEETRIPDRAEEEVVGGTIWKKWMVSNNIERTMPIVVSTATVEAASSPPHDVFDDIARPQLRADAPVAPKKAGSRQPARQRTAEIDRPVAGAARCQLIGGGQDISGSGVGPENDAMCRASMSRASAVVTKPKRALRTTSRSSPRAWAGPWRSSRPHSWSATAARPRPSATRGRHLLHRRVVAVTGRSAAAQRRGPRRREARSKPPNKSRDKTGREWSACCSPLTNLMLRRTPNEIGEDAGDQEEWRGSKGWTPALALGRHSRIDRAPELREQRPGSSTAAPPKGSADDQPYMLRTLPSSTSS